MAVEELEPIPGVTTALVAGVGWGSWGFSLVRSIMAGDGWFGLVEPGFL